MAKRFDISLYAFALISSLVGIVGMGALLGAAQTMPESEEVPEEVLQIQVDEKAYSRLDGTLQSPSQYAQEQKHLQIKPENVPARISPDIKQLIDLLRLRKVILDLIPFS